jgi:Family of unknown function (DUF6074)
MIVPFPLASRRSMILRQARYAARLTPESAERHIRQQLKVQGQALQRRGIDEDLIAQELRSLERAIRTTLWDAVATRGAP